ncbi:transposase [Coleofasciculus sp. C1-SOL-03]|uniref:transposase n=1 Tax=Coleofasciculus sp. C1-SOL-03 TaxID=3069522 RepID=UPI004062862D
MSSSCQLSSVFISLTTTRLKTRSHSAFVLIAHLVLVTKFRNRTCFRAMIDRLKEIFRETLPKWDGELVEFKGESDLS